MSEKANNQRFHGSRLQVVAGTGGFSFFSLLFVQMATDPGKGGFGLAIFDVVAAFACAWMALRSLRCATVIGSPGGVAVRSTFRTRRWTWNEVRAFEVRERPVGVVGWNRRVLYLHLRNGTGCWLVEMNTRPRRWGSMDEASQRLNGMIDQYAPPASN